MPRTYYWIVSELDGKPYLIYGGESYGDAYQIGLESLGVDFTIRQFPTRDVRTASAMFRGKRLDQTRNLRDATKRIRHIRPKRHL